MLSVDKLRRLSQKEPLREITYPWYETPQVLQENLSRLADNPYLDVVTLRGGNARRALNPPPKNIRLARQQAIEKLTRIDPDYAETDWDLNFPIYIIAPETFQTISPDPNQPVYVTNGCAIAIESTSEVQRQVLQIITSGWPLNYPHAKIKTSSSTRRPYLVIGEDADVKITHEHQPVNKTKFDHLFELFAEPIDIRHIPLTDDRAFSDQLQQTVQTYYAQIGPAYELHPHSLVIKLINDHFPPLPPIKNSYTPAELQIIFDLIDQKVYYPSFPLDTDHLNRLTPHLASLQLSFPPKIQRQIHKELETDPTRARQLLGPLAPPSHR